MGIKLAVGALIVVTHARIIVVTHARIWNEPLSNTLGSRELDAEEQELLAQSRANDSWYSWWYGLEIDEPSSPTQPLPWWKSSFELLSSSMSAIHEASWWRTAWTATDLIVVGLLNMTGGLLFGHYWPVVCVALRVLLGLSLVFATSLALGFAWQ
eukprot:3232376-Amphidinium_carterae.1